MSNASPVMRAASGLAACLGLLLLAAGGAAEVRDLSSMKGEEIKRLQQRLADDGCYKGETEGKASDALEAAKKGCPSQEPIPRIETGMHVAAIRSIGVDAQCRIAATGSDDKTLRLWSMPDGKLIRTQRLPIGDGHNGEIYAVAVAPDGRLVAAGGWDAYYAVDGTHGVYLFDSASGASVRRLGGFDNIILRLAFSRDGRRLAVASAGKNGLRIFDVATGGELAGDRDFSGGVRGLAFGSNGTLYAVGDDGNLRRYDAAMKRTAMVKTPGGKLPGSVAVDPSGARLAVGYYDTLAMELFDARDLRRLGLADTADFTVEPRLSTAAWSQDGSRLFAGGGYMKGVDGKYPYVVRSWTSDGRKPGADAAASANTIMDLAPCGAGAAFAAADPVFGIVKPDGAAVTLGATHSADMTLKFGGAFMVSADATRVRFGLDSGQGRPILFDLSAATLADAPDASNDLAESSIDGFDPGGWLDEPKPKLAGKPFALEQHEVARSLAARGDKSGFALGASSYLRSFDAAGVLRWRIPGPGEARGVNLARNDSIILAAYGDGTIRWHRWSDGRELLALFVDATDRRWVAWTPTGYYMASAGGEDLIGWQVNRGWDEPADFFPASRFRDRFNRPDIVRLVLETLDEGQAVKRADETARRHEDATPLAAKLPPVATILSPASGAHFSGGEVTIEYTLRSPSGLAIDRIEALVDGQSVQTRGFERVSGGEAEKRSLTLAVPAHDVEIGLAARSGELTGDIARLRLIYDGARAADADLLKPKLYALVVGVSRYADAALRLGYAAEDAKGFAAALQAQKGGLYSDVEVKLVVDADATSLGVKKGLVWLRQQTTSRDLAMVYLAGHGVTDAKGKFWFLTEEADMASLLTSAVSRDDLIDVLYDLPGKKALFLDACHAGAALNAGARGATTELNSAVNDFVTADSGLVAFAASTGREFSIEREEWGHGAFTKALIEAIGEGKATIGTTNEITTASLDAFLAQRVKELTGGAQHPVMTRPQVVPDFPIAIANH